MEKYNSTWCRYKHLAYMGSGVIVGNPMLGADREQSSGKLETTS